MGWLYHPITINQHGDILDGQHRLKVCQELWIKPGFEVKEFDDELLEEPFVIDTNVARRQLNAYRRGKSLLSKKEACFGEDSQAKHVPCW